ncbi:hypothetical protein CERSUDRAFT_73082 [Gelatoporia subvermispora B]|uniref:Uncharacterized protein n=1 Tax=Ceriporiopsis subvermispora (strain B) TaxID=914234 RepID=M2RIJ2_CERS8|nr:hypothetical protein CERSUDRAFT_73082 [Gelatoporia subvermispora B]
MDPDHVRTLQMLQAYCGCLLEHNPRNAESFWYIYYTVALSHLIPTAYPRKVFLAPQYILSHNQVDNDGKTKKNAKVPDFCFLHIDMEENFKAPDSSPVEKIKDYQGILDHFRGPYKIRDATVLAILENKGLPRIDKFKRYSEDKFKEKIRTLYMAKFRQAFNSIVGQTGVFFAAQKDAGGIVVVAMVGPRFCWANCDRSSVPVPSDNDDSTFEPDNDDDKVDKDTVELGEVLGDMYGDEPQADQEQHGNKTLRPRHAIKRVSRVPQLVSAPGRSTGSQTVSTQTVSTPENEGDNEKSIEPDAAAQVVDRVDSLQLTESSQSGDDEEEPSSSRRSQPLSRSLLIREPGWRWSQHYAWTDPASWDEMRAMMDAIRDRNPHIDL